MFLQHIFVCLSAKIFSKLPFNRYNSIQLNYRLIIISQKKKKEKEEREKTAATTTATTTGSTTTVITTVYETYL